MECKHIKSRWSTNEFRCRSLYKQSLLWRGETSRGEEGAGEKRLVHKIQSIKNAFLLGYILSSL